VAGYESNGEVDIAKYWINKQEVILSDGTTNAYANSIVASGNNVYVAGTYYDKKFTWSRAVIWKNNNVMKLPATSTSSRANSIFVSGRDVYVAGYDNGAVYWKNGEEVRLNTDGQSAASSIFVAGKDVYIAGSEGGSSSSDQRAVYWKNGVAVKLIVNDTISSATSIFVSKNDVYVVGSFTLAPGYFGTECWKNGTIVSLAGSFFSEASQVFVSGDDVYVAGAVTRGRVGLWGAVYWKNGIGVDLTINEQEPFVSFASSIYVLDNDVYVGGSDGKFYASTYISNAVYWKNGIEVKLTNGLHSAAANSIYAK
jgi:hypothetical protein